MSQVIQEVEIRQGRHTQSGHGLWASPKHLRFLNADQNEGYEATVSARALINGGPEISLLQFGTSPQR